jgi:hypothetical protein
LSGKAEKKKPIMIWYRLGLNTLAGAYLVRGRPFVSRDACKSWRLFVPPVFRLDSEINGRTEREHKVRSTFNQCTWSTVAFVVLNCRSSKQKYLCHALSLRPALCTMQNQYSNYTMKIYVPSFCTQSALNTISLTRTTNINYHKISQLCKPKIWVGQNKFWLTCFQYKLCICCQKFPKRG